MTSPLAVRVPPRDRVKVAASVALLKVAASVALLKVAASVALLRVFAEPRFGRASVGSPLAFAAKRAFPFLWDADRHTFRRGT